MFETILFNKVQKQMISQQTKAKILVQKMRGRQLYWKLKYECLQSIVNKLLENKECDGNTRNISIQNQNQMVNFNA